jgi:hypothetical protein
MADPDDVYHSLVIDLSTQDGGAPFEYGDLDRVFESVIKVRCRAEAA